MDDIIETHSVGNMVHMSVNGEYTQNFLRKEEARDGSIPTRDDVDKELFDTKLLPKLQAFAQANGMAPIQSTIVGDQLHYTSGTFTLMMYEEPGGILSATNKFVFEFNTYDQNNEEIITAEQQDEIIDIIEAFVQEVIGPVSPIGTPASSIPGTPVRSLSQMTAETQVAEPLTPSANDAPDFFEPAPQMAPVKVFERVISESDLGGRGYEGEVELSPIVKQFLYNPEGVRGEGVLTEKAATLIRNKLNDMRRTIPDIEEFVHAAGISDEGTQDEMAYDKFTARIVNGEELLINFEMHQTPYLYILCLERERCAQINLKDKIEQALKETVQELQGEDAAPVPASQSRGPPAAPAARQLNFGAQPVQNRRPTLTGKFDRSLTFYEQLAPAFSKEDVDAKAVPINNTVFDQENNETVMLDDFVRSANKLVFSFGGKQTGISYRPFIRKIQDGDGIFYECTRVFPFNPDAGQLGTFEYYEIYAQPYIELALTSRFYIPLEDFQKLLNVPVHPYWEIKDTGKTLAAAASRSSVVLGGPVQSQLHCQDGSDLKVYTLEPYMPTPDPEEEEEDACPIPQIVTLQRGEERTQVDISENNTVLGAKTWYANEKGLTLSTLKIIFMGKILKDEDLLTPGTVVMVMGGQGGRRTYRRRKQSKRTRKTSKA